MEWVESSCQILFTLWNSKMIEPMSIKKTSDKLSIKITWKAGIFSSRHITIDWVLQCWEMHMTQAENQHESVQHLLLNSRAGILRGSINSLSMKMNACSALSVLCRLIYYWAMSYVARYSIKYIIQLCVDFKTSSVFPAGMQESNRSFI